MAIHSAKDLPETLRDGIDFLWLPWHEDPRDVIVLRKGVSMPDPDEKVRIGISSARREAYCAKRFPNAELAPVRGNIADRIAQLDNGKFDLLILAAAGLGRLGLHYRISEFISASELEPPSGQGHLAVTFRKGDPVMTKLRLAFVKPVVFAGAGPSHKGLMTLDAADALAHCEICLYDSLLHESSLSMMPEGSKAIFVGKRKNAHSVPQSEICRMIADYARQGKRVVRLKGGDPGIFGRLAEEVDTLSALHLPFKVIPGISSMNAASTQTGLLLTRRGAARGFTVMTPRKSGSGDFAMVSPEERSKFPLLVFMGATEVDKLCVELVEEGRPASTPASIVLCAGSDEQQIISGSLETLPLKTIGNQQPGLIIIGDAADAKHLYQNIGALASKKVLLVCSETLTEKAARKACDYKAIPIDFTMTKLQTQLDVIGKLAPFKGIDWLVVSSPSSAKILLDALMEISFDLRKLPKIISCGPGTSEELKKFGIIADAEAEAPYGADAIIRLASKIVKKGEKVLRLRSDAAGESLAEGFEKLGAKVEDAVIYENIPVRRESLPPFDFAFFSSASGARAFTDSFGKDSLKGRKCVAIGAPTLNELKRLQPGCDAFMPEKSTAEAAIEALAWRNLADILHDLSQQH